MSFARIAQLHGINDSKQQSYIHANNSESARMATAVIGA
jgi:hypothetical protein